jgi:hypothetical protein
MTIAQATRRIRNAKGSSFLTHGGDDHDHRAANKARRMMDQAVIGEWDNDEPETKNPEPSQSFRVVVQTQYRENYGAHCWDGEGECPQHWKNKGGSEYHVALGSAAHVIALGSEGIRGIVSKMAEKVERCDDYAQEWVIGWEIYGDKEETPDEREDREMAEWGYPVRERDRTITI